MKKRKFVKALADLGSSWELSDETLKVTEEFISELCGKGSQDIGLCQKYPPPPPPPPPPQWTRLNWVAKNFKISKKDNGSLCRIPNPADSNSWAIPEFCKILKGFAGIPIKIRKIWENSWNSSQTHRACITGFPMSSMGVCGYLLE